MPRPTGGFVEGTPVTPEWLNSVGEEFAQWSDDVNGGDNELSNVRIHVPAWITITLLNSWTAFGTDAFGAWAAPAYRKDMSGRVWIRGRAKLGTTADGTKIFELPNGCWPPSVISLVISAPFSTNLPQLVIKPNGDCLIYNVTAGTYLDLNVSFSTT